MKRLLYLALAAMLIMSLALIGMTSCDKGNETGTEASTQTEAAKETAAETAGETTGETEPATVGETETTLADLSAEDLLDTVGGQLNASLTELATSKLEEFESGKVSFSMPTNLRMELSGSFAMDRKTDGESDAPINFTYNASLVLAESGISASFTIPNMGEATIICVGDTIYVTSASNGSKADKGKITVTSEMLQELMGSISGGAEGDESDSLLSEADAAKLKALLTPFLSLKTGDIFQSVTREVKDGNVTVTCKGVKADLITSVKTTLTTLFTMFDEEPAETETAEGELSAPSALEQIFESIDATKWENISLSLTVDSQGRIVATSADLNLTIVTYNEDWEWVSNDDSNSDSDSNDDIKDSLIGIIGSTTIPDVDIDLSGKLDGKDLGDLDLGDLDLGDLDIGDLGDLDDLDDLDGIYDDWDNWDDWDWDDMWDSDGKYVLTGVTKTEISFALSLQGTITYGDQKVEAPSDADSYEDMLTPNIDVDIDIDIDNGYTN